VEMTGPTGHTAPALPLDRLAPILTRARAATDFRKDL
jgi:hypothetical protein